MIHSAHLTQLIDKSKGLAMHIGRGEVDMDIMFHCFLLNIGPSLSLILEKCDTQHIELFSVSSKIINSKRPLKNKPNILTPACHKFLEFTEYNADTMLYDDYVSPESLLMSFFLYKKQPKAVQQLIEDRGPEFAPEIIKNCVLHGLGTLDVEPQGSNEEMFNGHFDMFDPNPILERFAINLNQKCIAEPATIIDFDNKIEELATVLCRKQKPNALLVGPAGTGKTSLAKGLAAHIVSGQAPQLLSSKVIFSVNLASMVAGTQYRGQFEERLEEFVKEVKKYENIILFIDEVHTLVGAGGSSRSDSLEASNILKPSLADGSISCIGATTPKEYNNTIKLDSALNRRFEYIAVREPSAYQMAKMLPPILKDYEEFHGVKYGEDFKKSIIRFCDMYSPNRNYPDKAIDVIDQCGAQAKVSFWETSDDIKENRLQIFNEARKGNIHSLPKDFFANLDKKMDSWAESCEKGTPEVTTKHLAAFFHNRQSPLFDIDKIKQLRKSLDKHIIGQRKPLSGLFDNIMESNLGFSTEWARQPQLRVVTGESGSGKTGLLKGIESELARLGANVQSFHGSHFTGPDIFYKIYGFSGQNRSLCDAVQEHPDSIILIDDFDKISTDMVTFIDNILKTGVIQTRQGETVDFSNVMFFVTAPLESSKRELGFHHSDSTNLAARIQESLKKRVAYECCLDKLGKHGLRRLLCRRLRTIYETAQSYGIHLSVKPAFVRDFCAQCEGKEDVVKVLDKKIHAEIKPKLLTALNKGKKRVKLAT